ncbi:MAG: stage III sporulation protein AA [Sporomusaceae bacterium]|nr:stage III sporulation protein AA [Sporomusaceae bacterium]
MSYSAVLGKTLYPLLAAPLAAALRAAPPALLAQAGEVRVRAGQPLLIVAGDGDVFLDAAGRPADPAKAYIVSGEDVAKTLQIVSRNSLYACEEELRQGFLTVAGGHRIGIAGQAVLAGGELKTLKHISALNIRLAREIRGAADAVMPYAVAGPRRVLSCLVISPPRCGKTTVLRDMARQLSGGVASLGFAGVQVGIVDERSELAACRDGVPTADLGPRVDVLDGCPKAVGMLMLVRSMAPQAIITDELGREADAAAVREASHAGVAVVASAHGRDAADIAARPFIGELIADRVFERYIILGDKPTAGTVREIAAADGSVIYRRPGGIKACG